MVFLGPGLYFCVALEPFSHVGALSASVFTGFSQALLAERVTFRQRLQMIQGWAIRRLHQAWAGPRARRLCCDLRDRAVP